MTAAFSNRPNSEFGGTAMTSDTCSTTTTATTTTTTKQRPTNRQRGWMNERETEEADDGVIYFCDFLAFI
jgi:hypothetical protein